MTDELAAWLGKQIDEDEKRETSWYLMRDEPGLELWCSVCGKTSSGTHHEYGRSDVGLDCGHSMPGEQYRERYLVPKPPDPRAMAEIKFKRSLLDALAEAESNHGSYITATYTSRDALLAMAAAYADRPGYDEAIKS